MVAAVSGVKEYYHSYLYAQSVQQAEQRYNATHDTHHHHHSYHGHSNRRIGGAMDVYKELVIMIIAFADHTSVLSLLHSIEGPRLTGEDVFVGCNVPAALLQTLTGALSSRIRGDQSVRRRSAMLHRLGIFV